MPVETKKFETPCRCVGANSLGVAIFNSARKAA